MVINRRVVALLCSVGCSVALLAGCDGDPERRVRQAMTLQGMSERDAREALSRNDKARSAYVRHFYGADAASPRHYHLVIDSTAVPLKACTELIVAAVEACRVG